MNHDRIILAIVAVTVAVILIGEVIVYTSSTDSFDIDADISGSDIEYSISVRGSQVYSVVAMSSGMLHMSEVYVYYDANYGTSYEKDLGPVGSHELDQEYYIDQLVKHILARGSTPVTVLSAVELEAAMTKDLASGSFQKGLVVVSGALPDTIYIGDPGDLIFNWLSNGGRLYWAGNILGKYVATPGGITDALTGFDYQMEFFGASDCQNTGDAFFASEDVSGNSLRYDLSLKNNYVRYGIDVTKLPSTRDHLSIGYTDGTYDSIVFVSYGNGMVCVVSGNYSRTQYSDLAHVVASNVCYSTVVIETVTGSVRYGNDSGSIDISGASGHITVYAYLGGYFPVYGKLFPL